MINSLYIKSFWIEGWGNRNVDDDKRAKNANLRLYIENWTNVYACSSCKLFINNECLVYIHSLYFSVIIYVTKSVNKKAIQYFLILISNKADFPVCGPSSFVWYLHCSFLYLWAILCLHNLILSDTFKTTGTYSCYWK